MHRSKSACHRILAPASVHRPCPLPIDYLPCRQPPEFKTHLKFRNLTLKEVDAVAQLSLLCLQIERLPKTSLHYRSRPWALEVNNGPDNQPCGTAAAHPPLRQPPHLWGLGAGSFGLVLGGFREGPRRPRARHKMSIPPGLGFQAPPPPGPSCVPSDLLGLVFRASLGRVRLQKLSFGKPAQCIDVTATVGTIADQSIERTE